MATSGIASKDFVCAQSKPQANARLFLFPYSGGGPAVFNKWRLGLPASIECWSAHYPGRGSRYNEPLVKNLLELVEQLSNAIRPHLNKPFAFFGHSLGALVAFELARSLRTQQLPQPNQLFVSACGAPHMPDPHPPIHHLPDSEFQRALENLNGIPHEVLQNEELLNLSLPILRADFEMIELYQYQTGKSLDCPIIAFGGRDDPRVNRERLEGWKLQTASRFETQYFASDHFFLNNEQESLMRSISANMMFSPARNPRS